MVRAVDTRLPDLYTRGVRALAAALVALAGAGCLNEPPLPDEAPGSSVSVNAGGIPIDVRFGTLESAAYAAVRRDGSPMSWRPDSRELVLATTDLQCESSPPCAIGHFELTYSSAAGASTIGSINAALFTAFAPSPDGDWLAYKVLDRPLYLIRR